MSCTFASNFKEVGKGILTYIFWDVYEVTYLKSDNGQNEIMKIKYLRDIEQDLSKRGWTESLAHIKDADKQIEWLRESTVNIKKGDLLTLSRSNGENVSISYNGKIISKKNNDKKLYRLIYEPWLGDKPVDEDLKQELLSGK